MRLGWRRLFGIFSGVRLHLEEVVRLIFDDDEIVLLGNGVNGPSSLDGCGGAGWVLAGGDGVDKSRLAGAVTFSGAPVGEGGIKSFRKHAFGVHGDTDYVSAEGTGSFGSGCKSEFFGDEVVTALEEYAVELFCSGSRTNSESASPVPDSRIVDNLTSNQYSSC